MGRRRNAAKTAAACARACACAHVRVYVCACACVSVCMCACACICVHVRMCVFPSPLCELSMWTDPVPLPCSHSVPLSTCATMAGLLCPLASGWVGPVGTLAEVREAGLLLGVWAPAFSLGGEVCSPHLDDICSRGGPSLELLPVPVAAPRSRSSRRRCGRQQAQGTLT